MYSKEQKRLQEGKGSVRLEKKSLESYEKDSKILNTLFIERSLFVKTYMIFRKFDQNSGAPFLELANFYHVLSTNPMASKLYKDTIKVFRIH